MKFTRSIRWRLQLWHGFILLAVLVGFGLTAWQLQQQRIHRTSREKLNQRFIQVIRLINDQRQAERARRPPPHRPEDGPPRRPGSAQPWMINTEFQEMALPGETISAWMRDGRLVGSTLPNEEVSRPENAELHPQVTKKDRLMTLVASTPPGEIISITQDLSADLSDLNRIAWQLFGAGFTILALGLVGGWWAAGRSLRPIASMSATAARLSAGNLGDRLDIADREGELGQLACTLNDMLARLDASFTQQMRFISDASHELRTPVTVLLTQTQSALRRDRPPEEYRQSLEACQRAAQRMRQLIESLLALARLDAGEHPMKSQRFDLANAATEQMELLSALAAVRGITLNGSLTPLVVTGDPDFLTLILTNLITNAIHYNKDGGTVDLTLQKENGFAILKVSDTGQGLEPADMDRIFERFYRADQSRSLPAGRTGLGLSITKTIIEKHHGTITVESTPGLGSCFTVRLPISGEENSGAESSTNS